MIVTTTNFVAISVLSDRLREAVRLSDSSKPDSLGDRLFRASLRLSQASRSVVNGALDADVLAESVEVLNEYEHLRCQRLTEKTGLGHYRPMVWEAQGVEAA